MKPESILDSSAPDRTKPLNFTIGRKRAPDRTNYFNGYTGSKPMPQLRNVNTVISLTEKTTRVERSLQPELVALEPSLLPGNFLVMIRAP